MIDIVLIKILDCGKIYQFRADNLDIKRGDGCIVETQRGVEYGVAISEIKQVDQSQLPTIPNTVIRKATHEDLQKLQEIHDKERKAIKLCLERIKHRKLPMKLVRVCFLFDLSKAIFYFTADGRIDFRGLVKDLAYHFRTRIEMRQIGVRDETKMLGGIGCCGRPVCCSTFLTHFEPVSIKMAKNQSLSLITSKISGLCGRLMCCLVYENNTYSSIKKVLPPVGTLVQTKLGKGTVVSQNILSTTVKVEFDDGDIKECHFKDIQILKIPKVSDIKDGDSNDIDYDDNDSYLNGANGTTLD